MLSLLICTLIVLFALTGRHRVVCETGEFAEVAHGPANKRTDRANATLIARILARPVRKHVRLTDHVRLNSHRRQASLAPLLVERCQVLVVLVGVDNAARVRIEMLRARRLRAQVRVVVLAGSCGYVCMLQLIVIGQLLARVKSHLASLATFAFLGMRGGDERFVLLSATITLFFLLVARR